MVAFCLPIAVVLSALSPAPGPSPALLQEPAPATDAPDPDVPSADAEEQRWRFAVRPYVWAASISGSVGANNQGSFPVDRDFGDILDDLDFAWMMQLEARTPDDRLGLLFDALYIDLDGQAGPADWDLDQKLLELDVTWRVAEGVELLAGARYVDIDAEASAPSVGAAGSGGVDWVDPVVGARGQLALGERWSLRGRGDIGGFGVGSDFSWQVAGYVVFSATSWLDLGLGYRHLDIQRDKDGVDLDLALSGPLLGLGFQF